MSADMKRQCINHPKYMYSGKEASPLGLGVASEPLALGTIQEGKDKTNWIVTLKNGVKVWSRITRLSEVLDTNTNKNTLKETDMFQEEQSVKKKPTVRKKLPAPSVKDNNTENQENSTDETSNEDGKISVETVHVTKEQTKRKPTSYNLYMKYRLKQLVKENTTLKPKERITHAVAQWKSMTANEKEEIVKKAIIALENGEI